MSGCLERFPLASVGQSHDYAGTKKLWSTPRPGFAIGPHLGLGLVLGPAKALAFMF